MPQPAYALRPRATALALQLLPYAREIFALKETDGDQTKAGEILEIGQFSMNKIAKKIRKIATEIGDIETLRMLLYPPHAQERLDALEKAGGNKAEAARHSGITRAGFCYFVKRTTEVATKIEDVETLNRIRRSQLSQLPHHTQATLDALEKAGGNQAEAARIFNITRPSVDARIKRIRKIATETGDNDTLERLEKLLQLARLQLPYYTQATLDALEETGGNRTEAAKILDTRQPYVSRRIKRIRKVATEIGDIETLKRLLLPHHTQATLDALEEAGGNQAEAA